MAATLQSRELQSLQSADVLSRVYEVQRFFQDLQKKFGTSATTTSLSNQQSAVLVHTSHFITCLCQCAFIEAHKTDVLDNADQRDAHSKVFQLCIDNAMAATKEYVWLLQLNECTNIAVRSFHLMYNGLGAAFLLADLGELRRNSNARSTVQELLLHAPLLNRHSRTDDPTWAERTLQRLSILAAKAESASSSHCTIHRFSLLAC
jgi:hypothetical protein